MDTQVKAFWDGRAQDPSNNDSEVTHRDIWQRWLEIETLKRYLRSDDRLLDVGCGAGYTTRLLAPLVREAVGVDYSESMIERARAAADHPTLTFEVSDVMSLRPGTPSTTGTLGTFDAAVSSRCLINLAGWPEQQQALHNIAGMLKPGGRFLFLEGLADGRDGLNHLRVASGLEPMPKVWHNVDFVEHELQAFLAPLFTVVERRHFGVYDFIARVVHPLLVAPDAPQYEARINEVAARLALNSQEYGEVSRVLFLVLERR
jgi:SAM-dependent methyltransferase